MRKLFICMLLLVLGVCVQAKDAVLNIRAGETASVSSNGKTVTLDGQIIPYGKGKENVMEFGEKCYSIPAKGLIGNSGSMVLEFALAQEMKQSKSAARPLAVIRWNGREEVGFFTFSKKTILQYRFANSRNNFYGGTKPLKRDKIYQAVFTWNGEKLACYLDGTLIREADQPFKFKPELAESINIGPYADRWYKVHPWPNDTMLKSLKLYKRVLSAQEVAEMAGMKNPPIHERFPRVITAPARSGSNGMSPVTFINMRKPFSSWELPKSSAAFSYDDKNLYVDFSTIFPAKTSILKGATASDPEAGVWGVESFELHLRNGKDTFYFGGTVNGGKTDVLNKNAKYNPEWSYKSHIGMQIDDTFLWTGKVVLPWKALKLQKAPKQLKLNFCRSFFNSHITAPTDLASDRANKLGYWGRDEFFFDLKFDKKAPSFKVVSLGNPSFGQLEQEFEVSSPVDTTVKFQILQESEAGLIAPQSLADSKLRLKANIPQKIKVAAPLTVLQADRLLYRLTSGDGKKVYFSQDVPLQISAEYLGVKPLFYADKLQTTVKTAILKSKFGEKSRFTLRLKDPKGKVIWQKKDPAENLAVPFAKNYAPGNYTLELVDAKGKLLSGKSFVFPGYGAWNSFKVDASRIVPPYQPLAYSKKNNFTASVVLRDYSWNKNSLLPAQITSKNEALFSRPAALLVNGKEVTGAFKTLSTLKHRADVKSSSAGKECKVSVNGYLEYDGVQHNMIEFTAQKNISALQLRFTLPAKFAKYLHTSAIGWGNKLTQKIENGKFEFKYYPVVFIGNEEKGFCFFAESCRSWKPGTPKPLEINKKSDVATFTVTIARNVKAGQKIVFDCGLLGTPVKPQHKRYPLNTASWNWNAPMNRPGKTPTSWSAYMHHAGTIADAFADVPGIDNEALLKSQRDNVAFFRKHNVKPFNYNPFYISDEFPEVRAFGVEWESVPRQVWTGFRDKKVHTLFLLCPASKGADYFLWKIQNYLKKVKADGINFDFGIVPACDNAHHGCNGRTPLIAYRNFYRKLALLLIDSGAKDYIIHVHNTNSVQLPAYTFVTHLMNGEHIRQQSSTLMHNGKDILDTYKMPMFACELSSMPFGIYNAVYQSNDFLLKQYGGGKEDPELYKLRITRAFLAGTLLHNTILALNRCHHGIFDKIVRIYDKFDVPEAEFIGYWSSRNPAKVVAGKEVYASIYRHKKDNRLLAVISHAGNERLDQDVEIKFTPQVLGMKDFKSAVERLEGPDPEYDELFKMKKAADLPTVRIQLKWQNPGIKVRSFENNVLKLHLPAHSFALVELN